MNEETIDLYCPPGYAEALNEQKTALLKHFTRNEQFVSETNNKETFKWLVAYNKNKPKELSLDKEGAMVFNAQLKLMGIFNTLMMEFAQDELDKPNIERLFNNIRVQKEILENHADKNS